MYERLSREDRRTMGELSDLYWKSVTRRLEMEAALERERQRVRLSALIFVLVITASIAGVVALFVVPR